MFVVRGRRCQTVFVKSCVFPHQSRLVTDNLEPYLSAPIDAQFTFKVNQQEYPSSSGSSPGAPLLRMADVVLVRGVALIYCALQSDPHLTATLTEDGAKLHLSTPGQR